MTLLGVLLLSLAAGCSIAAAIIIGDTCYRCHVRKKYIKIHRPLKK